MGGFMLAPESAENVTTIPEANEPRDWDVLLGVLDETMQTLRDAGIPFLLIGGIGSAVFGRDRGTRDIDLFVRPENAKKVLELLGERGYTTKVEYEHWLYKAFKHDVLVDVIFRSSRDILLDEEMLRRARTTRSRSSPPRSSIGTTCWREHANTALAGSSACCCSPTPSTSWCRGVRSRRSTTP